MTAEVACELQLLVQFVQSGLLGPILRKRLAKFPQQELTIATRDILDWLSLRSILRDRNSAPRGLAHPMTGRVLAALPALRGYICMTGETLAYRIEVEAAMQRQMEDYAKDLIWHPMQPAARTGRRKREGDQSNLIDSSS